jgi:hypothetical protein
VVAIDSDLREWPDADAVSRLVSSPGLPFFSGIMRGVAIDGRLDGAWVAEAARVVTPGSRVVVTRAADWARTVLEEAGMKVLASEAETVVAVRG